MKIHSVTLNKVRGFATSTVFDFASAQQVNTVSGINGSGKSTLFKSIILAQKGYFLNALTQAGSTLPSVLEQKEIFPKELAKYFNAKGAFIEVNFNHAAPGAPVQLSSFKLLINSLKQNIADWTISIGAANAESLSENWNIAKPKEIIVYIDSDKHFEEQPVYHSNISFYSQDKYDQLTIETILKPENIYANIYQSLVKDYLVQRMSPAQPKRDIYYNATKLLLAELAPTLELSNFSGQYFDDQFVLLGKNNIVPPIAGKRAVSQTYDTRNLSSGEKALFYTLLFISYVPKIGMLIIDEPENHFHEELLVKFVKMLSDIASSDNFGDYIISMAKGPKAVRDEIKNQIIKYYKEHKLSQIFLLTHSKGLVYNNFSNGINYYVDGGLRALEFDTVEKVLRTIGLSSIYPKVLFVEGSTDEGMLDFFFNKFNIKVQGLGGHGAVIQTYNKLLKMKGHLRNYHFCFVIDRDTHNSAKTQSTRSQDTDFFDEHFFVLDRHELENYLLDSDIFFDIIENHRTLDSTIPGISKTQIEADMEALALADKSNVITKALMELNDNSVTMLKPELVKKTNPISSVSDYRAAMEALIDNTNVKDFLLNHFVADFIKVDADYSTANWNVNWKTLCDGKKISKQIILQYFRHLKIDKARLEREVVNLIQTKGTYEINNQINLLISKFD